MGVWTLLRRRLRRHPLAVGSVVTAALMSMIVVGTLQLLSTAISDAGVRSALGVTADVTDPAARTVRVNASLDPTTLQDADALVRSQLEAVASDVTVSRVALLTSRGIKGAAGNARAQLADVDDLAQAATLIDGRWPEKTTSGLDVALPVEAARELNLTVGQTLALTDLVSSGPDLVVTLTGTYEPKDRSAPLWLDAPLALTGVQRGEFTTFGPFALAPGVFESGALGSSPVTWRGAMDLSRTTTASVAADRTRIDDGVTRLRVTVGDSRAEGGADDMPSPLLRSGKVDTTLTSLYDDATLVAARIRASLLTPTVLLILLGAASLVMATRLLTTLRAEDTSLLRTRGISSTQLGALAVVDAAIIVVIGAIGAVVSAPALTRLLGRGANVDLAAGTIGDVLGNAGFWLAVGTMAALTTAIVVLTAAHSGSRQSEAAGRAPVLLRLASGSGLDLALVALAALAVLQLRRYDAAGSTALDPLTIAAPACVIGGLAVLCLRLLPMATRQVERVGTIHAGLDRAWGAWQLSRRLAAQGGTILLILLCVAMGVLGLSHSATADRAIVDQSAFESGAPVRVDSVLPAPLATSVGGGVGHAMPVLRDVVDLRTATGVTVLGIDATTGARVMDPRADTLRGASWPRLLAGLADARPDGGLPLPAGVRELTVTLQRPGTLGDTRYVFPDPDVTGQLILRDGRGHLHTVPIPSVPITPTPTKIAVPQGDQALPEPLSLIGFASTMSDFTRYQLEVQGKQPDLTVRDLRVDGARLALPAMVTTVEESSVAVTVPATATRPLPVLMTKALASTLDLTTGAAFTLPIAGRSVPATVSAIVDSVPTAREPDRAILLDLPTLQATPDRTGANTTWPTPVIVPAETWLAPAAPARAVDQLRDSGVSTDLVVERSVVVTARRANPVNAGMQAAMLLVTGAAVVLAAVGFAATTASLARERHHENAILLALGMPPSRIRRVLTIERLGVVVLTVLAGVLMGVVAAHLVVPFLVGGDGHVQVPPVRVAVPWRSVVILAAGVAGILAVVGVLVLRRSGGDLARELRMGDVR